ncbi:MAG: TrbC/VirB2 family protein, partial [Desulfovibrio sp.]|nr:TrbC/VirB2 family protein [Desulfovibrio sp.]
MRMKSLLPAGNSRLSRLKPMAVFGFLALCLCFPDIAAASGGITEFSSPLERVVNTITGPAGKWISIVAMALYGVIFIMNKNENNNFLLSHKIHLFLYNQI